MSEQRWQIELDRFGIMFSGPLEIGECIEVAPVSELEDLRELLREACDLAQSWVERVEDCDVLTERDLQLMAFERLAELRGKAGSAGDDHGTEAGHVAEAGADAYSKGDGDGD